MLALFKRTVVEDAVVEPPPYDIWQGYDTARLALVQKALECRTGDWHDKTVDEQKEIEKQILAKFGVHFVQHGLLTGDAHFDEVFFGRILDCCAKGLDHTRYILESWLIDKRDFYSWPHTRYAKICLRLLGYHVPTLDGEHTEILKEICDRYRNDYPYSVQAVTGAAWKCHEDLVPTSNGISVGFHDVVKAAVVIPQEAMRPAVIAYIEKARPPFESVPLYNGPPLVQQFNAAGMAAPRVLVGSPGGYLRHHSSPLSMQKGQALYMKWLAMQTALETAGAETEIVAFNHKNLELGLFARDRVFILGHDVFVPDINDIRENPKYLSRRAKNKIESDIYTTHLAKQGYNIHFCEGSFFEGGNLLAYPQKGIIFAGYTPQGGFAHLVRLAEHVNAAQPNKWDFVFVPLMSSNLYHLDVGMTEELPDGEAGLCKQLTTEDVYYQIIEIIGKNNILDIGFDEASGMAANLKMVSRIAVLTSNAENFATALQERKYDTILPRHMGQEDFIIGQGGVHCMTNELLPRFV